MKNKCIFFTLVILSTYRIFQELLILLQLNLDKGGLQTLFTAIGILLISYILPLSFMSILFLYKKKISLIWFLMSLFFGIFVIGQISGWININVTNLLNQLFPHSDFIKNWTPSISPPLFEEVLKFLLAIIIILLAKIHNIWHCLIIGLAVGLGFQISEDYTYLIAAMVDKQSPITEAFSRVEFGLATHWLMTSLMIGSYFLKQQSKAQKWAINLFILCPIFLHIAWNSPYTDHSILVKMVLFMFSWIIYITLLFKIHQANPIFSRVK